MTADICTFEMVERAPGRWTLTATCSPVERSLALYTCRAATLPINCGSLCQSKGRSSVLS